MITKQAIAVTHSTTKSYILGKINLQIEVPNISFLHAPYTTEIIEATKITKFITQLGLILIAYNPITVGENANLIQILTYELLHYLK